MQPAPPADPIESESMAMDISSGSEYSYDSYEEEESDNDYSDDYSDEEEEEEESDEQEEQEEEEEQEKALAELVKFMEEASHARRMYELSSEEPVAKKRNLNT